MSVPVAWSPEADADSLRVHHETATSISTAVYEWARSVDSDIDQAGVVHIRAEGCVALVELRGGTAYVQRIVADEPLPLTVALLDEPEPPESR